jgi:hypothetical protein
MVLRSRINLFFLITTSAPVQSGPPDKLGSLMAMRLPYSVAAGLPSAQPGKPADNRIITLPTSR